MPRPKTKSELVKLSEKNFLRLNELVDSLSVAKVQMSFPEGMLNRNVKDVLAHLHEWHLMLLDWYETDLMGEKPDIPRKGYTWKTLPDLNKAIWEKYKGEGLEKARSMLNESHMKVMSLIQSHTDEELFEKKRYKWTGSTSLGAYLISSTSSHYDWAYKLIKKALK